MCAWSCIFFQNLNTWPLLCLRLGCCVSCDCCVAFVAFAACVALDHGNQALYIRARVCVQFYTRRERPAGRHSVIQHGSVELVAVRLAAVEELVAAEATSDRHGAADHFPDTLCDRDAARTHRSRRKVRVGADDPPRLRPDDVPGEFDAT